ncbi:MAG: bifunctional tetrahydrofolate synthase/dihydrofolate synthase [Lysobacteraceae bacterium]
MNLQEWLAYQQRVHPTDMELGLDRLRAVAAKLGPIKPAKRVISVAGTNGKGSTAAMIDAIARASGWRVGLYTSPHLQRYNERVRIDGREVEDASLVAAFERIEAARGDITLTYFEYATLAALLLFADADLDLAVLEVGLGGRLDAVNLIDADVAVITTVALDHMEYLGNDRDAIGVEKGGIMRRIRPLILAELDPPESLLKLADQIGAKLQRVGKDFSATMGFGGKWRYSAGGQHLDLPVPMPATTAQLGNAAAAITALRALEVDGFPSDDAIRDGVSSSRLPARLQRIVDDNGVEWIIDVAHNPQAARELSQWLIRNRAAGSTQAVFAALGDKDIPNLIGPLLTCVDVWRLAGLTDQSSRGISVEDMWGQVAGLLSRTLSSRHATVNEALTQARQQAQRGDRIVVFGSFFTAASALKELEAG